MTVPLRWSKAAFEAVGADLDDLHARLLAQVEEVRGQADGFLMTAVALPASDPGQRPCLICHAWVEDGAWTAVVRTGVYRRIDGPPDPADPTRRLDSWMPTPLPDPDNDVSLPFDRLPRG